MNERPPINLSKDESPLAGRGVEIKENETTVFCNECHAVRKMIEKNGSQVYVCPNGDPDFIVHEEGKQERAM